MGRGNWRSFNSCLLKSPFKEGHLTSCPSGNTLSVQCEIKTKDIWTDWPMSFPHQGIQATGKRDFLGEWHQDLRPEPQNLRVCAREVSRWSWGWHHQDCQHPICGKTWCLYRMKCVLLWPAAATLGSHLIGMCVFPQAIVLLDLLWHFDILNIQSWPHEAKTNKPSCIANLSWFVSLSIICFFFTWLALSLIPRRWWTSWTPTPFSCEL